MREVFRRADDRLGALRRSINPKARPFSLEFVVTIVHPANLLLKQAPSLRSHLNEIQFSFWPPWRHHLYIPSHYILWKMWIVWR